MTNAEIADVLEHIAMLLELQSENPFRIRAYRRAAQMLTSLPRDVRDIYNDGGTPALEELPGIGKDLAEKMEELLKTGKLAYIDTVKKRLPEGLFAILHLEGMGPKKTKFVWEHFKVKSVADLEKLARSGKLATQKGWGEKSVQKVLKSIEMRQLQGDRVPLFVAREQAEALVEHLRTAAHCTQLEIAGSARRGKETVGDIDILASGKDAEAIITAFCAAPSVQRILAQGSTKASVILRTGLQADLRVVDDAVFGAAWHYFTGSKAHNVKLRTMAIHRGITISEYGVHKGSAKNKGALLASRTEKDVYAALHLPFIPPELREDQGEIEAAQKGELPDLITATDLRFDLHTHTDFSDGTADAVAMAKAAKAAGLAGIAITDHASSMGMVKGIKTHNIAAYMTMIDAARTAVPDLHILAGAEVDILPDGTLYLPDAALAKLDWVVASVHGSFTLSREEQTERLLRAIRNPHVRVIGHPTARMLGGRAGMTFDVDVVFAEAAARDVALELNASVERLDLSDVLCRRAKEVGAKISINSDTHSIRGFGCQLGITQARRGWLTAADVINTWSWKALEQWRRR